MTDRCQLCSGQALTKLLFLLLSVLAASLLAVSVTARPPAANAQTTDLDNEQVADPEPQTPNTIAPAYHDEMTPEEVQAECDRLSQAASDEYDRLIAAIAPYETSHPGYYQTEKEKIETWRQTTSAEQATACQTQKQAAEERQLPASQTPAEIIYSYHDEMTSEDVQAECDRIDNLIADEVSRLQAGIAPYVSSHPDYYTEERAKISDWQTAAEAANEAECQRQRQAAEERQALNIDDLYPEISPEIKSLANRIGLTDRAKRILYNNGPLILDDPNHPDFTCGGGAFSETYIHGCWDHKGPIKLLRDNSIETTLAHELLHVIYYREYYLENTHKAIDDQIDIVVSRNRRQANIILEAYAEQINSLPTRTGRYIKYTELYAFIGTQFTTATDDLETHYAKYFKDRAALVDIFHDWVIGTRAKILERETYHQQLVNQAGEYLECLNDVNRTDEDCQTYEPDRDQYAAYDNCLASRKTFLADCRQHRPAAFIAYTPAPLAPLPPSPANDQALQTLIDETEKLVSQVQEEQEAIEESFIHQLVFYDHELDEGSDDQPSGHSSTTPDQPAADEDSSGEEEADKPDADTAQASADSGTAAEERVISTTTSSVINEETTTPWNWLIISLVFSLGLIAAALFVNLLRRPARPEAEQEAEIDNEDDS